MRDQEHWERVYADNAPDAVSWFEAVPGSSLGIIDGLGMPLDAPIVDVGGGLSRLAAALLDRGHSGITVLGPRAVCAPTGSRATVRRRWPTR